MAWDPNTDPLLYPEIEKRRKRIGRVLLVIGAAAVVWPLLEELLGL